VRAALACGLALLSLAATALLAGADADRQVRSAGRGRRSELMATWPSKAPRGASYRLHAAHPPPRRPPRCTAQPTLAEAFAPILRQATGRAAVGVADTVTGLTATYGGRTAFDTASIVKVEILAALLLNDDRDGIALDPDGQSLASQMIEVSDNDAASTLWDVIGGPAGVVAADRELGLRHTEPDPGGYWGLTATTVTDQLRLLADLTTSSSPLRAGSRHYELSLLRHVDPGQEWGVSAAADPGTRPAVKDGWLPVGPEGWWTVNSIGVISHSRHKLLIAVLCDGQPSFGAGMAEVEGLARAAAAAVTAIPQCL
jgi:Beta-lactamase enzyme family